MTTLVTGGSGFLGAHVVGRLVAAGRPTIVFSRKPGRGRLERVLGREPAAAVRIVAGDVRNRNALLEVVQSYGVDRLVHLAAALSDVCNADPPEAVDVNIGGLVSVLEVARSAGLRRVVWASTGGVFGGHDPSVPAPNDAPYTPHNLYGAMKAFGESLAKHYFSAFGVDSIALRFPFLVGQGIGSPLTGAVVRELVVKPALGQPGVVPWGGDRLNGLWVGDAADAVLLALDVPATRSRAFNLDGDTRTIAELAAIVRRLIPGARIALKPERRGFPGEADAHAAVGELGFRRTLDWEAQIRELIRLTRLAAAPTAAPDA